MTKVGYIYPSGTIVSLEVIHDAKEQVKTKIECTHVKDYVKETHGARTIWHMLIGGFSKSNELSNAETGEL
jgi:hypothetical protein